MFKITDTLSFDFGEASSVLIKGKHTLTKRAAASSLLKYAKSKDQEDLHIIALGAYEGTGYNRNMDRFMEKWCIKNAHYFKDANRAVHRHHKNKPDSPKYGNIKAAAYNPEMRRIELIVGLDKHGAQDILDEQEKVGHTNWSMASKQAYDICTWCNHKASTDEDRCEHIPDKLGEMNKEGAICGMDNPDPKWFEISYVKRPADRIGMSLQKMAGSRFKPLLPRDYLQIYTEFEVPADDFLISKKASAKRELLNKLSELEKHLPALAIKPDKLESLAITDKLASNIIDEFRKLDPNVFFKSAADKGIILSPDNFFSYVFGDKIKEANINGAKTHLQDIYQTINKQADLLVNSEIFDITNSVVDKTVSKLANSHSLFEPYVNARLVHNLHKTAASTNHVKSEDPLDKELALTYGNYKLAALNYLDELNKLSEDLMIVSLLQNR